jgi:hypothetical protein
VIKRPKRNQEREDFGQTKIFDDPFQTVDDDWITARNAFYNNRICARIVKRQEANILSQQLFIQVSICAPENLH